MENSISAFDPSDFVWYYIKNNHVKEYHSYCGCCKTYYDVRLSKIESSKSLIVTELYIHREDTDLHYPTPIDLRFICQQLRNQDSRLIVFTAMSIYGHIQFYLVSENSLSRKRNKVGKIQVDTWDPYSISQIILLLEEKNQQPLVKTNPSVVTLDDETVVVFFTREETVVEINFAVKASFVKLMGYYKSGFSLVIEIAINTHHTLHDTTFTICLLDYFSIEEADCLGKIEITFFDQLFRFQ